MINILENDNLSIAIETFGAELKSVKNKATDKEYMWYADKKFWGRTSPVLFPFVGSLKNKEYTVNGQKYSMGQHGFARDMEFTMVEKNKDSIWFELVSDETTKAKYPFDFVLRIGYELKGNAVKVLWEVKNLSSDKMPFSIGAHPAFICPTGNENSKKGYKLSFGKAKLNNTLMNTIIDYDMETVDLDEIHHHGNIRSTGLALTEDITLPLEGGKCEITPTFFDRCTYMIEGNQANKVGIVNPEGVEYITVLFDTPLFAIWSPEEKNAPFVCIEPWYGRCDHVDFDGDIYAREYTNLLEGNETFHAEYVMKFN